MAYANISNEESKSYIGRVALVDNNRVEIFDASKDNQGIIVWFENDGTKWAYASELEWEPQEENKT